MDALQVKTYDGKGVMLITADKIAAIEQSEEEGKTHIYIIGMDYPFISGDDFEYVAKTYIKYLRENR